MIPFMFAEMEILFEKSHPTTDLEKATPTYYDGNEVEQTSANISH